MKIKLFLILIVILLCSSCTYNYSTELSLDDIFVSSAQKELSDFDMWLTEEIGLDWVPSYLVLEGHYVLGVIKGGLSIRETKEQLAELKNGPIANSMSLFDIYNPFSKSTTNFVEVLPETGLNIIEIHMIGCKDCEEVDGVPGEYKHPKLDENGEFIEDEYEIVTITGNELCSTNEIRQSINANYFRYYVRSTYEAVIKNYI